jgi:UDP-N-acetylglucosamine--N-acetylmuramyl-(pentapeptide) pyrophosphoryl-undecaprenol N-acetylglucosamine transferase
MDESLKQQKRIIFTGGGSSGHVVPNLALIKKFKSAGWEITYVGSKNGMEKDLVAKESGINYFAIASGKLRRYFSWQNFFDPFKIVYGIAQSLFICQKIRPQVIFSKGGFVAFPLVMAAWLNRIPVVAHESDLTPGLANKLSFPLIKKLCVTFVETANNLGNSTKVIVTGTPVRQELISGNAAKGLAMCEFSTNKKVILVMGGGSGSEAINIAIRSILPKLLINFQVVHICGKAKMDNGLTLSGYKQFEYLYAELADIMACASIIISRAGANAIYEFLTLKKPHILIPLPLKASRGDQISNAEYFAAQGLSEVLIEEKLSPDILYDKIIWMSEHENEIVQHLEAFKRKDSVQIIYDTISEVVGF